MQRTQSYQQAINSMEMAPMLPSTSQNDADIAINTHASKNTGETRLSQYIIREHDLLDTIHSSTPENDTENQNKVSKLMSKLFSVFCENYYQRCKKIEEIISRDTPSDEEFIQQISCGPMYKSHCIRFIRQYIEKFGNHSLFSNTVLADLTQKPGLLDVAGKNLFETEATNLERLRRMDCPVTRLSDGKQFMKSISYKKYVADEDISATEILDAMLNEFSWIDCNMAYEIVHYLLTFIISRGEKLYDKLFSKEGIGLITIDINGMEDTPLWKMMRSSSAHRGTDHQTEPPASVEYGTVYYFKNHTDYLKKHPQGPFQGHNVILVEKESGIPTFTAFGLSGKGLNAQQIKEQLVDQFNCDPFEDFHGDDMHGAANNPKVINMNKLRP